MTSRCFSFRLTAVNCLLPSCGAFILSFKRCMEISSQESNRPDNAKLSISQQLTSRELIHTNSTSVISKIRRCRRVYSQTNKTVIR